MTFQNNLDDDLKYTVISVLSDIEVVAEQIDIEISPRINKAQSKSKKIFVGFANRQNCQALANKKTLF